MQISQIPHGRTPRTWKRFLLGTALAAAASMTAAAAIQYTPPDPNAQAIRQSRIQLSDEYCAKAASMLAACARSQSLPATQADVELTQMLIGLGMQFDPGNKDVVVANAQLKRGVASKPATPISKRSMAATLLKLGKKCEENAGTEDLKLAGLCYSLAVKLDEKSEDALYALEVYSGKQPAPDWSFLGAAAPEKPADPTPPAPEAVAVKDAPEPAQDNANPAQDNANIDEEIIQKPIVAEVPQAAPAAPPKNAAKGIKEFMDRQKTVSGLVVLTTDGGRMIGGKMDIILTVGPPRESHTFSYGVVTPIGKEMHTSLKEAMRTVRTLYPFIEPADLAISFDDKYSPKDGGSAGTAFTLGILGLLEGIKFDPDCAITGDVTVDSKIRMVGGVPEKIRGAILAGCKEVIIPGVNEQSVADMTLIYDMPELLKIQILSASTVPEAMELIRADKKTELKTAMAVFDKLQGSLLGKKSMLQTLRTPAVKQQLQEVLLLAPNHLSAKYLLMAAQNQLPKQMSLNASLQQIVVTAAPLSSTILSDNMRPDELPALPKESVEQIIKDLATLGPKVDPTTQGVLKSMSDYAAAILEVEKHRSSRSAGGSGRRLATLFDQAQEKRDKARRVITALSNDRNFLEQLMKF